MLNIDDLKKKLGSDAESFTDQELEKAQKILYSLANSSFSYWLKRRNSTIINNKESTHKGLEL